MKLIKNILSINNLQNCLIIERIQHLYDQHEFLQTHGTSIGQGMLS